MRTVNVQELTTTRDCRARGCRNHADGEDGWCSDCRGLYAKSGHPAHRFRGHPLSPSELAVVQCAADGYSREETASRLRKGVETIKTQRRIAIGKLEAHDMTHAVAIAFRSGLID